MQETEKTPLTPFFSDNILLCQQWSLTKTAAPSGTCQVCLIHSLERLVRWSTTQFHRETPRRARSIMR